MATVNLTISTSGIDDCLKAADPKQVYTILMTWYARGTTLAANELRSRAPKRLKRKVYVRMDVVRPPRWARIGVRGGLSWLVEGGTGRLGDPSFNHGPHWPSTDGIMKQTGLPRTRAFAMARAIGLRGGNPPQPYIRPTWDAVKDRIEQMGPQIANEVLR